MNLIQTLPEPDARNTVRWECAYDYREMYEVRAVYEGNGRQFKASAERSFDSFHKWPHLTSVSRVRLHQEAMDNLHDAMADWLKAVNPIDNSDPVRLCHSTNWTPRTTLKGQNA